MSLFPKGLERGVFFYILLLNPIRYLELLEVGSYILASNIVEFDIPTYLGLYPSFLVAVIHLQLFAFYG